MFDDFEDNGREEEDSSDAEYADIDATADDNVFGGTQKDKTSVSEKESIVFLVDCAKTNRLPISKNYFYYGDDVDDENTKESEQTQKSSNYVQVALNAYRNVLRDRVVCTPDDEIGLVFYNTKNRSGELEFDNIFVFHELALLQFVPQLAGYLTTQAHALEDLHELLAGLAGAEAPGAREEGDKVDAGMERFAPQLCRGIFFLQILCGVLFRHLLLFFLLGLKLGGL